MREIASAAPSFTLPTYSPPVTIVGNVNNGLNYALSTALSSGKNVVLFFINFASTTDCAAWLEIIRLAESPTVQPVAVCFSHNGIAYAGGFGFTYDNLQTAIGSFDPNPATAHGYFDTIPVLLDNGGTVGSAWLTGIVNDTDLYGRPAGSSKLFANLPIGFAYGMWAYIIGPDDIVRDKWHNEKPASDPLALMKLPGAGASLPTGSALASLIADRCGNLSSPLEILSVEPGTTGYLAAAPASINLAFSRPLDAATAGAPATWALGGNAVSAGAGNASTADYTGKNFIENTVSISHSGVTLDDSGGSEMTLTFTSLRDTAGGLPAAGHDRITWDVSTSVPSVTDVHYFAVEDAPDPNPDIRYTAVSGGSGVQVAGFPRIEVDFTFNEPLPDQANPVTIVDRLGTNPVQPPPVFTINTADRTRATLAYEAAHQSQDGEWAVSIAADALVDGAGVRGPAAAWNGGTIIYDCAAPKPVVTIDGVTAGAGIGCHKVRITVSFGEAVNDWTTTDIAGNFDIGSSGSTLTFVSAGASPGSYIYDWSLTDAGSKSITVRAGAARDIPLNRNTPASDPFSFTYNPVYTDLVVVVDKSGSMGWNIPFDSGSGPVNTPKWTVM
jgi:hypothetical protein